MIFSREFNDFNFTKLLYMNYWSDAHSVSRSIKVKTLLLYVITLNIVIGSNFNAFVSYTIPYILCNPKFDVLTFQQYHRIFFFHITKWWYEPSVCHAFVELIKLIYGLTKNQSKTDWFGLNLMSKNDRYISLGRIQKKIPSINSTFARATNWSLWNDFQ